MDVEVNIIEGLTQIRPAHTFAWVLDLQRTICAEELLLRLGGYQGCRQTEAARGHTQAGCVAEIDTIRVDGSDSCNKRIRTLTLDKFNIFMI